MIAVPADITTLRATDQKTIMRTLTSYTNLIPNLAAKGARVIIFPEKIIAIKNDKPVAILRGIENGFTVVRNAQWGLLSVTNSKGQILAKIKTNDQTPVTLLVNVPAGLGHTFYDRTGDGFAWGVVGLLLICFVGLIVELCLS